MNDLGNNYTERTMDLVKTLKSINELEIKLHIKNKRNKKHINYLQTLLTESSEHYYKIVSNLSK